MLLLTFVINLIIITQELQLGLFDTFHLANNSQLQALLNQQYQLEGSVNALVKDLNAV